MTFFGLGFGLWLYGAAFTASAMIGVIARAGIVVRSAILLVDCIRHGGIAGEPLRATVLRAGAIRFKPILLTAVTSVLGAWVIVFDPIFSGLAWSFVFGIVASTVFTMLVIPVMYALTRGRESQAAPAPGARAEGQA